MTQEIINQFVRIYGTDYVAAACIKADPASVMELLATMTQSDLDKHLKVLTDRADSLRGKQ